MKATFLTFVAFLNLEDCSDPKPCPHESNNPFPTRNATGVFLHAKQLEAVPRVESRVLSLLVPV